MKPFRLIPVLLCLATSALGAPVVSVEGVLRVGGEPASGVFTVTIDVVDDGGDTVVAESVPSLAITDGFFSVDVDLAGATDALVRNSALTVEIDLGDGLVASGRLGAVAASSTASRALLASSSTSADRLGDILPAELLQAGEAVDTPVAFANLTDLAPGIGDGIDNGTVTTIGTGLVLSGGILNVAANGVGGIVDGTLTGLQVADGTVSGASLNSLAATKVIDGALTGANFTTNAFSISQVGTRPIFRHPPGCESPGILSTESLCARRSCDVAAFRTCDGLGCDPLGQTSGTDLFCSGAGEGHVTVGRLILD